MKELIRLIFANNDGIQVVFGFPQGLHYDSESNKHFILLKDQQDKIIKEWSHKIWVKDIIKWEQWNI